MKFKFLYAVTALLTSGPTVLAATQFQRRCNKLSQSLNISNTEVILSEYVAENTNITFSYPGTGCATSIVAQADMCRLLLNVTTSSKSSFIMETWMPVDWTSKGQRFLMTGNSGWAGCIATTEMAYNTKLGFATAGQNNGNKANSASAFYNSPQTLRDFSYRALLKSTKVAKKAVNHFYQTPYNKAYFSGCSTGGRQAFKAAQDFPEEFDGILASAPVINFNGVYAAEGYYALTVGAPGSPTFLTYDQWLAVEAAVFAQCDGIDGVLDQVLEDPMKCQFRAEAMLCGLGQTWVTNQCLTSAQIESVKKIYTAYYGNNGRLIYPRIQPGNDQIFGFYINYGANAGAATQDFFRYAVYKDPSWSLTTDFNLDAVDHLFDIDLFGVSTFNPDLTALKNSRHKVLHYQGLSDPLVTSEISYQYYEDVARNMSLPSSELDEFYRYFPISGLNHCFGGKGAGYVGGPTQLGNYPGADDVVNLAEDSALMALVRWVEGEGAPETLRGYKIGTTGLIEATKDHCKHPLKTTYKGVGDPTEVTSWKCV
ncbi:Tannase [Dactylellina cionopaga]|nr:Tannase [Dactylellina cionopaga]